MPDPNGIRWQTAAFEGQPVGARFSTIPEVDLQGDGALVSAEFPWPPPALWRVSRFRPIHHMPALDQSGVALVWAYCPAETNSREEPVIPPRGEEGLARDP